LTQDRLDLFPGSTPTSQTGSSPKHHIHIHITSPLV
jgi:hypothetical protein